MSTPDFEKLTAANDELERLLEDDELTQEEFDRLLEEASKAVGDSTEFLEGILMRGVELGFVKAQSALEEMLEEHAEEHAHQGLEE